MSLNNTSRFDAEYTNSVKITDLLSFPKRMKSPGYALF